MCIQTSCLHATKMSEELLRGCCFHNETTNEKINDDTGTLDASETVPVTFTVSVHIQFSVNSICTL